MHGYYNNFLLFRIPPAPPRTQHGVLKVVFTSGLGLYIGATMSSQMAAFLEENELFVPEEEIDDVE